jgi:hypothetical protein
MLKPSTDRVNRLTLSETDLRVPQKAMIYSVVYRFRAIPFYPQSRLEIVGFAQSTWYRFRGARHWGYVASGGGKNYVAPKRIGSHCTLRYILVAW